MKNNIPVSFKIFIISFILFAVSQLVINSILTPLGTELANLNDEKDYLVEENRDLAEQIAKNNSIRVIEKLSSEKLSLSKDASQNIVYIEDSSLIAER